MIFQSFVAQVCGANFFFRILTLFYEQNHFIDSHCFLMIFHVFLLIFHKKGDGCDGGGDGGRIFLEDPSPINPRRDNISRKDNPSLRLLNIMWPI